MSDFSNERQVIEVYFQDNWNPSDSIVQYENNKFVQPSNATWCRFSITAAETIPAALGGQRIRTMGSVYLTIFSPKDSGTVKPRQLADIFSSLFDLLHLQAANGMIFFDTTTFRTIGDHNGFFQTEAVCNYRRDVDVTT